VRIADFADNADVRKNYPILARVADDAASPQIRNQATLGGNLCQRPRCWYFRNGFGLLGKDQQSGKSLVLDGDNRYHAILGNDGPAYFVSPSSLAPALIAAGARIRLFGPNGAREVTLEKFYVIPKSENEREHDLRPNEMVTEIMVPPASLAFTVTEIDLAKRSTTHEGRVLYGHYEVRQKAQFDWPLATASVALLMSGTRVLGARIVLGHVAPIPWVCPREVAATLIGQTVTETTANAAGVVAAEKPGKSLGKNAYKIHLARVAVKRAILQAAKGA
jgi:xanthine dehydrogenase YagS FAD-binding subunit